MTFKTPTLCVNHTIYHYAYKGTFLNISLRGVGKKREKRQNSLLSGQNGCNFFLASGVARDHGINTYIYIYTYAFCRTCFFRILEQFLHTSHTLGRVEQKNNAGTRRNCETNILCLTQLRLTPMADINVVTTWSASKYIGIETDKKSNTCITCCVCVCVCGASAC